MHSIPRAYYNMNAAKVCCICYMVWCGTVDWHFTVLFCVCVAYRFTFTQFRHTIHAYIYSLYIYILWYIWIVAFYSAYAYLFQFGFNICIVNSQNLQSTYYIKWTIYNIHTRKVPQVFFFDRHPHWCCCCCWLYFLFTVYLQ